MQRSLIGVAAGVLLAVVTCSPCLAIQVTMSSSGSSFVQGEPIYVWIDYYNDSTDEVAIPRRYMSGTDALAIRNANNEIVKCAFEAKLGGSRGGNQVRRIGAKEHYIYLENLLAMFNLKDVGSYSVQVSTENYKPELDLDKDHPLVPASELVTGKIESNRVKFSILPGSGGAYELAATDKKWGLVGLHHYAGQIARDYPDSPYAPYAIIEQVDQLLYAEGSGPEPLKDRLVSARTLMEAFYKRYANSPLFNIAVARYAERLTKIGQNDAAARLSDVLQQEKPGGVAALYLRQVLSEGMKPK